MNDLPPPPRWFLLLPILAIAAWWPIEPYWQSDDFLALHYARTFANVLHDFVGPQYGATDIWLFYRPLITASFWVDLQLGGADPFVSHLSNVLAHGVSALLVALIWRRFLPRDSAAFCAGLVWAMIPGHIGSLAWAVGRVDSHTTVWCLLAVLLFLRQCARVQNGEPARRWPALVAVGLALASKELAFILPALLSALALFGGTGGFAERLRFALRESAPAWLLFGAYFGFRWLVLGRFGGYLDASYDPAAMALGLGQYVGNLAVPMLWIGQERAADIGLSPTVTIALACVPLVPALVHWGRRPTRCFAAMLLFGIAAAPLAAFLSGADSVHNLRYFYFPSVVLAGMLAAPGRIASVLVIAVWALPLIAVRTQQLAADRESASIHRAIQSEANDGAESPMFVAGLPNSNRSGTAVQLHFGVDRMLAAPFGSGSTRLFALRPLADVPAAFRPWPAGEPFALPSGSTWWFADPSALGKAPPPPRLPDLPIEGDIDGVVDMSFKRLLDVATRWPKLVADRAPSFGLSTPGVRPQAYRLTMFTANGYLCCLCRDHGMGPAGAGWIDMLRFLVHDEVGGTNAAVITARGDLASAALPVPTTIDLIPEFPVLLEAGTMTMNGLVFIPTHRAQRLLTFRFDRRYPAWVRILQGRS